MDALSQEPSLDPWKHDVIVRKLEKDLLNHLRIPESDEELFIKQEDELMQISEMEYIKGKAEMYIPSQLLFQFLNLFTFKLNLLAW